MKPFTLEWWMQQYREAICQAEDAWGTYLTNRNRTDKRKQFIYKWDVAHYIEKRILNKYGE